MGIKSRPPMVKMVKNLFLGLPEVGKIKIGGKGAERTSKAGNTYQLPEKHDYFTVTTLHRDDTGNFTKNERVHGKIGPQPRAIPVRLVSDQMEHNFQVRYARYDGKTLACSGDGEHANEVQRDVSYRPVQCPCYRLEQEYEGKDKCKINGTLSVIIDGVNQVGGVWKFRTTSFNSVTGILSSIQMIRSMTGGRIAGLPLSLMLSPKAANSPKGPVTIHVVGLVFVGTVETLLESSYKQAKMISSYQNQIKLLGISLPEPSATEDYSTIDFDGESDFASVEIPDDEPVSGVNGHHQPDPSQPDPSQPVSSLDDRINAENDQETIHGEVVQDKPKPDPKPKQTKPKQQPTPEHVEAQDDDDFAGFPEE